MNSSPIKDKIVTGDARHMDEVEDASVALVVTSPPYFAGKEYEEALGEGHIPASYLDYLGMLTEVFAECVRTLEPGGRIAVNVANLGRKPYRSLSADVITILQDRLGLLLRGEVIWHKARGASGSCAWGSFRSPANPVLRDLTERVVIASKGRFDRALTRPVRQGRGPAFGDLADQRGVHRGHHRRVGAPEPSAPPGSGTPHRSPSSCPCVSSSSTPTRATSSSTPSSGRAPPPPPRCAPTATTWATTPSPSTSASPSSASARSATGSSNATRTPCADPGATVRGAPGGRASCSTRVWVQRRGAEQAPGRRRRRGLSPGATARARQWLFDFVGAFTTANTGLRRTDALWKALGKAAVIHAAWPEVPLVLLTTAAPAPGSAGDQAWRSLGDAAPPGAIGAVYDVVELGSTDAEARLCRYASRGPRAAAPTRPAAGAEQ